MRASLAEYCSGDAGCDNHHELTCSADGGSDVPGDVVATDAGAD